MPRQTLHIQKTEVSENRIICFMNNACPIDQFDFIKQKLQICDLKYSAKYCFGLFLTAKFTSNLERKQGEHVIITYTNSYRKS